MWKDWLEINFKITKFFIIKLSDKKIKYFSIGSQLNNKKILKVVFRLYREEGLRLLCRILGCG